MKTRVRGLLVGFLLSAICSNASAGLILEFAFSGSTLGVSPGTIHNTLSTTVGGITATLTPYKIDNNGSGTIDLLTLITSANSGGGGIYVSSSTTDPNVGVNSGTGDSWNDIDGDDGVDEGLMIEFSQTVDLLFVNYDGWSSCSSDDFNLTVDGTTKVVDYCRGDTSSFVTDVPGQYDEYLFNNIRGTEFLFWADGSDDDFRIGELLVHVPVPSSLVLLFSGLFLLGRARRVSWTDA